MIPERARHLADMFGFETTYDSVDAMLADPDVEMVDICTPTDTHLALAVRHCLLASMCCARSRSR